MFPSPFESASKATTLISLHCAAASAAFFSISSLAKTYTDRDMKIFDWVHRRFNPAILRDEFGSGKNGGGCMALGPQEGVDLSQVLDGWKDFGILTIGTFGYDPLKHLEHDSLVKEDGLEVKQGFPDDVEIDVEAEDLLKEELGESEEAADAELDPLIPAKVVREFQEIEVNAAPVWDQAGTVSEVELMSIKKRVTLADLFSVDSDAEDGRQAHGDIPSKVSSKCRDKQALKKDVKDKPLAKKFLKGIRKEDLHPMRKINRLMKKMMGRKIHPEVPGTIKADIEEDELLIGNINPSTTKVQGTSSAPEITEFRPLLQSHRRDGTR